MQPLPLAAQAGPLHLQGSSHACPCPCLHRGGGGSLVVAGGTAAAADGQAWCHGTKPCASIVHATTGAILFMLLACTHAIPPPSWFMHMHNAYLLVIGCGVWCRCMGALHVSEGCWMAGRRRVGRHTEWWASGAGGINKSAHMST